MWQPRDRSDPVAVRYLVAEFGGAGCAASDLPVTLRYDAVTNADDFSLRIRIPIDAAQSTLRFVPAYYNGSWSHFTGFELPVGYENCLRQVSAVDHPTEVPVLLDLTLAPGWQHEGLFQRLTMWEVVAPFRPPTLVASPETIVPAPAVAVRQALTVPDLATQGVAARDGGGWTGRVAMRAVQGHLLGFPPVRASAGDLLRLNGTLRRGGLLVGLVKNGLWVVNVQVTTRGDFQVGLEAPSGDEYGVLITDFSPMPWREEPLALLRRTAWRLYRPALVDDFDVTRIGWLNLRQPS